MSQILESDYLETREGLYFAVKGIVQPPDRIYGILRYVPDPNGDRVKAGRTYRRLYHFAEQKQYLEANNRFYRAFDPVVNLTVQSVPRGAIQRVYTARASLQALRQKEQPDPVEADALGFAGLLQELSGIPWDSLGLSGSLAIGLHTPASDLDLTVHGDQDCRQLHQALKSRLDQDSGDLRRLDERGMQALHTERSTDTSMEYAHFLRSERQKVNQGTFQTRPYFIRFLKEPEEYWEKYGDHSFFPTSRATIEAVVTDDRDMIFTPCRYGLGEVRFLQGGAVPEMREIISFRGRFSEQARAGDLIRATGLVERVEARSGEVWHHLVVGNEIEDTMVLGGEG